MKRVRVLLLFLGVAAAGLNAAEGQLRVLTSFLPVYCFTVNVAGDQAQVENLLPGKVSPHEYQLSTGDLRKITSADLILINGLGVESFIEKAIRNTGSATFGKVVRITDGLESRWLPLENSAKSTETPWDPHMWLDPTLAIACVSNIVKVFSSADPSHAAVYQRNGTQYIGRLQKLDQEIREILKPVKSASFVTYHAAFNYFVHHYELKLAGVVERTPEVSPSARELGALYRVIRERQVKALFTEPASNPRLAKQIARDTAIRVAELDPLETGTLQPSAYEDGLRRNARTMAETLR